MPEPSRSTLDPLGRRRHLRRRRLAVASLVSAVTIALSIAVAPSAPAAAAPDHAGVGELIVGVGHFTLEGPTIEGHKIRFAVRARVGADGTTHGSFRFRHLLPDGELLATGQADVTCLQVSDGTAMFTAVVTSEYIPPLPPGRPHGPHAFYVKVIDGDRGPDQVVFAQATDPPGPLPTDCIDVENHPEIPELVRYPLDHGDYVLRG